MVLGCVDVPLEPRVSAQRAPRIRRRAGPGFCAVPRAAGGGLQCGVRGGRRGTLAVARTAARLPPGPAGRE